MQLARFLSCAVTVVLLATIPAGVTTGAAASEGQKEGAKPKAGLSLDELMKTPDETQRKTAREPAIPTPAKPLIEIPSTVPSGGQLSLDGIEAGREAVKTARARERVRGLGQRFESSCACLKEASCFGTPAFDHDEMNQAFAEQANGYELQMRELCAQWSPEVFDALPEDRQTLAGVATQLEQMLDARARMYAALDEREADFRAEEQRIRRAAAQADADAAARAQQGKKRGGFLASVLTLAGGAVVADSLGAQIDPEKLARTSINVGQAVRSGGGVAGALDAGVRGLNDMARTAVPKIDVASSPADGDYIADAMSHVKRFPEPGAASASATGSAQPGFAATGGLPLSAAAPGMNGANTNANASGGAYADLFSAVGQPGSPAMPEGLSPEAMGEARAALQKGGQMLASGVTPGGGGTDPFGVEEPTTERFEFVCKERSNVPLSDGAGGTRYYYERKITGVIKYWTPSCGPAFKAYYKAYSCNDIDDFDKVAADCQAACGAPDCRDTIYEQKVLGGGR